MYDTPVASRYNMTAVSTWFSNMITGGFYAFLALLLVGGTIYMLIKWWANKKENNHLPVVANLGTIMKSANSESGASSNNGEKERDNNNIVMTGGSRDGYPDFENAGYGGAAASAFKQESR